MPTPHAPASSPAWTPLGTLQDPSHGRESLASDLYEIARSHIERLVWRLFAEKELRKENFEQHAGGVTLNKSARQGFYAAYERGAEGHRRGLRHAAAALARNSIALGTSDVS